MKKILTLTLLLTLCLSACGTPEVNEAPSVQETPEVSEKSPHNLTEEIGIQYTDSQFNNLPIKATTDVFAMDTVMNLTVYSKDKETAKKALTDGAKILLELDNTLSTNIVDSELYQLNKLGNMALGEDGKALMKSAKTFYQKTDGIFNIAIYPLVKAWGFTTNSFQVPSKEEIKKLLPLTNLNDVHYDENTGIVDFEKKGMGIDFGGIAKGYASQKVISKFKEDGITSALISLGGNVHLLGKKPTGKNFVVGIQDPNNPEEYFCTIQSNDESIITSGAYQRYFEKDGRLYHHIIDPRTGEPSNQDLTSVTIISKDSTLADTYSTTLYILGKEKAIAYWKAHSDEFDMVLVDKDNKVYISEPLALRYHDNNFATPQIIKK